MQPEKVLKLYKLSQNINNNYDTYDSVIVCAASEEDARKVHPSEYVTHSRDGKWYGTYGGHEYETETETEYQDWVPFSQIGKIKVEYLGEAAKNIQKGVIVSSFNAG